MARAERGSRAAGAARAALVLFGALALGYCGAARASLVPVHPELAIGLALLPLAALGLAAAARRPGLALLAALALGLALLLHPLLTAMRAWRLG